MDWLKKHNPMNTDWNKKTLSFDHQGKQVVLRGLQSTSATSVKEVPAEQVAKWIKGHDIWAMSVVHTEGSATEIISATEAPEIQ
jgi:hypothetical protein